MSNICLVVLIGLPAAGKTSFYKYISDKLHLENTKISYISFDEQEKCMEKTDYKNFRSNIYDKIDGLVNKIIENNLSENDSKDNELIIIDDNMYYRSMRRSVYNLARRYSTAFCEIFIECSIDIAIDRNFLRTTDRVPTKVILEMSKKIEPPSKDNSWETYSCEINSDNDYTEDDVQVVRDLIQDSMKYPVQAGEEIETVPLPQSLTHNLDLMLRKLVTRQIKDAIINNEPHSTIETLSQELLLKKKSILDRIKVNQLYLPVYSDDAELEIILSNFLDITDIKNEEPPCKKPRYSSETSSDRSN